MLVNPTFADAETYVRDILIVAGIALIFIEVRYLYGVAVTSLEAELGVSRQMAPDRRFFPRLGSPPLTT